MTSMLLRVLAVLIGLRALTNVFKPLGAGTGFVFFGTILRGVGNAIVAPLFGAYMLVYAYGLWNERRFALPMGVLYATYVPINMLYFALKNPLPPSTTYLSAYAAIAVGVTWGAVVLLVLRRRSLER